MAGLNLNFNTHGNEKQKECVRRWTDNTTIDIVYGGAKAGGKSYTGCSLIFGDAFIYDDTHYFIARKTLEDLRKFTIPSIFEVFEHWGLDNNYYKYNGQDNCFNLYNGSKVLLLAAKDLPSDPKFTRFGSMQMTRGWIEEAGEFSQDAKRNLQISTGRWKNKEYGLTKKLLQTCNPSKNYLYREYYKKWRDGELESHKAFIQALPHDNKKLPPNYVEDLIKILDKNEIERLVYGNWEYDDDPACLMDYDNILAIFSNYVDDGDMYITADIARFGKDKTVIGVWKGLHCIQIITLNKSSVTESANKIEELRKQYNIMLNKVIVDEDGIGGGVKDILKCKGFINNSRSLNRKNFDNLKSQCSFEMAKLINKGEVRIDADDKIKDLIIEECEVIKKKNIDKDGRQGVIPKEKIKELIGRSHDYWDMIMMRAYFVIRKPKVVR